MLNAIVDASLRYKVLVLVAFAVVIGLGVQAFRQVPVDAFPDVTPIQVSIYTESPGLAAEDVEKLLTTPIEGGMAGLPGVEEVRSVSLFGLSYVAVYFKDNVDIYFARRLVGEKLQEVKGRSARRDTANPNSAPTARAWGRCSGTRSRTPTRSCQRDGPAHACRTGPCA